MELIVAFLAMSAAAAVSAVAFVVGSVVFFKLEDLCDLMRD